MKVIFRDVHRLLLLGFVMMISNSAEIRYCSYLLLRSMANILVNDKLVGKIDKLKFSFESSSLLCIQESGILISSYFANTYPTISSTFVNVCTNYAKDNIKSCYKVKG